MKHFVIHLIKIIVLVVFSLVTIEVLLLFNYDQSTDLRQDWHQFNTMDAEILFVGNSRMITHVDTRSISSSTQKSSYVLGSPGWGAKFINNKLRVYLENCKEAPKLIVYQADALMFKTRQNWYAKTIHLKYLLRDPYSIHANNRELEGSHDWDVCVPTHRYWSDPVRLYRDMFGIADERTSYDGFEPVEGHWSGPFTYDGGVWSPDSMLISESITFLRRIQKEFDCQIILIEPPFSAPVNFATQEARDALKRQQAFSFKTWNEPEEAWSDSNLFRNHSHLSLDGVALFTGELVEVIIDQH